MSNGRCLGLQALGLFSVSAQSKIRLCSANHRPGYWSNLASDWLSIVWAYSEQGTEKGPCWGLQAITNVLLKFNYRGPILLSFSTINQVQSNFFVTVLFPQNIHFRAHLWGWVVGGFLWICSLIRLEVNCKYHLVLFPCCNIILLYNFICQLSSHDINKSTNIWMPGIKLYSLTYVTKIWTADQKAFLK